MLNKLIETSLKNQLIILLLLAVSLGIGIRALLRTAIDAFPDTTPVQVQINTVAPALNPEEIEKQISPCGAFYLRPTRTLQCPLDFKVWFLTGRCYL